MPDFREFFENSNNKSHKSYDLEIWEINQDIRNRIRLEKSEQQ